MFERRIAAVSQQCRQWLRQWGVEHLQTYPLWERYAAIGLLLLAVWLNFRNRVALTASNLYYAAAVKSMLTGWHAFFFASFDPLGFVSVDKPPLGLWIQTVSAKIFGFSTFSLVLPEALAGIISVLLLYQLVRRTFGSVAGILAGLLLAISPINVVANRDNIFESLLVLLSLLAAWAAIKAAETGKFEWLALCGFCIGLGFNIKMLEAYLILPACYLTFYIAAPLSGWLRLKLLAGMSGIILAVSFWWVVIVDLVPTSQRPYVDSTLTNSEIDLIFNYNGLQRLFGQPHYANVTKQVFSDAGPPSLLRLFQPHLGGQVSWFLPLALIGLFSTIWALRPQSDDTHLQCWRRDPRHQLLVFWGVWLVWTGLFFTVGQFYNRYYLVMLAPAVCVLAAIGAVGIWQDCHQRGWRSWLLPLAVFATGTEQQAILSGYSRWNPWLSTLVYATTAITVFLIIGLRLIWPQAVLQAANTRLNWWSKLLSTAALVLLVLAPLCWLSASFGASNAGGFPISGPVAAAPSTPSAAVDPQLTRYLIAHAGRQPFLVATLKVNDATPIIFATGATVMALGGFSGYDPILTPASLAALIKRGEVRFFLLPATNLTQKQAQALYPASSAEFQTSYTNQLTQWVGTACVAVPPDQWKTQTALGTLQLFDCANTV